MLLRPSTQSRHPLRPMCAHTCTHKNTARNASNIKTTPSVHCVSWLWMWADCFCLGKALKALMPLGQPVTPPAAGMCGTPAEEETKHEQWSVWGRVESAATHFLMSHHSKATGCKTRCRVIFLPHQTFFIAAGNSSSLRKSAVTQRHQDFIL